MNDVDLKQALAPLFDDEPVPTPAARRTDLGRRALRRRRTTGLAVGTAVAAVAAIGVASLDSAPRNTGDGRDNIASAPPSPKATKAPAKKKNPPSDPAVWTPPFRKPPTSDAALTEACRQSPTTTQKVKDQFFGDGAAQLKARADTRSAVEAVYASADGSLWATCTYTLATSKYSRTTLVVFRAVETSKRSGPQSSSIRFCMAATDCYDVFSFTTRLPDEVAAVRFRYANDGEVETIPTNDGWVSAIHEVPTPAPAADFARIEYLDAAGKVLADNFSYREGAELWDFPALSTRPEQERGRLFPE